MDADIENKINKKRWERWRAKQDKEREKTYFHCWSGVWCDWSGIWQGDWGEWSDYCDDTDDSPNDCAHAKVEATLYASSNRIKVHYYALCCGVPACGGCALYKCYVRTKICGPGYCSELKEHEFGGFLQPCYADGDDWFDIEAGHENDEHYAHVYAECNCGAATGTAHAVCRVEKGT